METKAKIRSRTICFKFLFELLLVIILTYALYGCNSILHFLQQFFNELQLGKLLRTK